MNTMTLLEIARMATTCAIEYPDTWKTCHAAYPDDEKRAQRSAAECAYWLMYGVLPDWHYYIEAVMDSEDGAVFTHRRTNDNS